MGYAGQVWKTWVNTTCHYILYTHAIALYLPVVFKMHIIYSSKKCVLGAIYTQKMMAATIVRNKCVVDTRNIYRQYTNLVVEVTAKFFSHSHGGQRLSQLNCSACRMVKDNGDHGCALGPYGGSVYITVIHHPGGVLLTV